MNNLQRYADELDRLADEIRTLPPLTHDQIDELRRQAQEAPDIKRIREEIQQLKIIESVFTK